MGEINKINEKIDKRLEEIKRQREEDEKEEKG